MSEQLSLMGFEERKPTDRLFFALFPDTATAQRIAALADGLRGELGLKGRPLAPDRFHITLSHLGDYDGLPKDIVAKAMEAGAALAGLPVQVTFDRVVSFARSRAFVLRGGEGLEGIITFQRSLATEMAKAGLGRQAKEQFTPHVTLLYDDRVIEERAVEPISWTVREIVLVHSLLGQTKHVRLGGWLLRG